MAHFATLFLHQTGVRTGLRKEVDSGRLVAIAHRVCWWQVADVTLKDTHLFLYRVMVFATWEDICFVLDHYGELAFIEALQSAPPGIFDERSWHYWHHRLHILPVPPLPQRAIPA